MRSKHYISIVAVILLFFCGTSAPPFFAAGDIDIAGVAVNLTYYQGAKDQAVYKVTFTKTVGASNGISALSFDVNQDPSTRFSAARLFSDANANGTFDGTSTDTQLTTGTIDTNSIDFSGLSISLPDGTPSIVVFVVVDVKSNAPAANFQISLPSANVTDTNATGGIDPTGGADATANITIAAPTATFAQITGGVAANLVGGNQDQALIGFSVTTNGGQDINPALFTLNVDVSTAAASLTNFELIETTTNTYTGTGTPVGGSPTVTPGGSSTVQFTTNISVDNTKTRYYFLRADVGAAITGTPASVTTTFTSATATPGSNTGLSFNKAINFATLTASADATGITGLSNPIIAGTSNAALFAFKVTSNGTQTLSGIKVTTADPGSNVTNIRLVASNSSAYSAGLVTSPPIGTTVSSASTWGTGTIDYTISETITSTAKYFYLVGDIASNASTTFQGSLASANFTITGGKTLTPDPIVGTNYNINPPTLVVDNTGLLGIWASPLIGSAMSKTLFGFHVKSNGSQTITKVDVTMDDPTGKLLNLKLKAYDGPDRSTANLLETSNMGTYAGGEGPFTFTGVNVSTDTYFYLEADVEPNVAAATAAFQAAISNGAASITVNHNAGTYSVTGANDYDFQALEASVSTNNSGATILAGSTDQKIFSFIAQSNGVQTLKKIVFDLSTAQAGNDLSSYVVKIGGIPQGGSASYSLQKVTISGLSIDLSSAKTIDLFADLNAQSNANFTVSLKPADNLTDITVSGNLNQGAIDDAFVADITNAITVTPLEASVSSNNSGATILAGSTDQKIFSFIAQSNGAQTLKKIVFDLSTAQAGTDLSNYVLKIGGISQGGSASYSLQKVTISGLSIDISSAKTIDLFADFNTQSNANFTVSLKPADNATDIAVTGNLDRGRIDDAFVADITNAITVTPLEASITDPNFDATIVAGNTNQKIFSFTAQSNGAQTLKKIVFDLSTAQAGTDLSNYSVRIGGISQGGSASYSLQKITFSGLNIDISTAKTIDLHANVNAQTTASFVVSLKPADNPTDITGSGNLNQGYIDNAFVTDITTAVTITPLEAAITNNNSGATIVAGNSDQKIFSFIAQSNGTQTLKKIVFDLSTTQAGSDLSNYVVKIGGVSQGGSVSYSAQKITVSGLSINIATAKTIDLFADFNSSTTAGFTVSLKPADNPTDITGSGNLNRGYIDDGFNADITNAITVTKLEASLSAFTTGNVNSAVGGQTAIKILGVTAAATSGGSQNLTRLIFAFNTDVSSILDVSPASDMVLKVGGVAVAGATYGYASNTLTVDLSTSINSSTNFDLFADVLSTTPPGSFTVSVTQANHDIDNSDGTVNRGYVATFATIQNSVSISALVATINPVSGGTVLATPATLEAGTNNRAIFGISASSTGTQAFTNITFDLTNQPNGLTNFRLFKGTVGAVGASIATAADPGAGVSTISFNPGVNLTTTVDYFYLVADVKPGANNTSNDVQVKVDPSTAAFTLTTGTKDTGANSLPYTGTLYSFSSSATTLLAGNNGETTPIDLTVYSTKTAASGLTTANAQKLFSFTVGGTDSDNQATNLTQIRFNVTKLENLKAVALLNNSGGASISEVDVSSLTGTQAIDFGNGSSTILSVGDNSTVTVDVYGTFRSVVNDDDIIQFSFVSASTDGVASGISSGQGAFSSDGAKNNITVVATVLNVVTTNLSAVPITKSNPNTDFLVTATAEDALGNLDKGKTLTATFDIAETPTTEVISPSASQSWSSGAITWTVKIAPAGIYNLSVDDAGTLTTNSFQFQIESLGTSITVADLQSCVVGTADFYVSLPSLTITESDQGDFLAGSNLTFLLVLPDGWEFQTPASPTYGGSPSISATPAKNITTPVFSNFIGRTIAKFTYSVNGVTQVDALTISGLKVKNVSATGPGDIVRSGTSVILGADDTKSLGVLDLPSVQSTLDITVESQPGNAYVPPTTDRFGVSDPAIILNGTVGGNSIAVADGIFSGNGTSLKAIGAPINANRYIFNPAAVNVGFIDVTLTYTDPVTGCRTVLTKPFRVQNLAIQGLQTEFCSNDVTLNNLSVNSIDVPAGYDVYDYVYYDPAFANDYLYLTNDPVSASNSEVRFRSGGSPVPLTNPVTFSNILGITINPFGASFAYDYYGYYGGGYVYTPITNPALYSYLYVGTSFVQLNVPSHGLLVGDKFTVNGYLDYIYPSISFQEFTVTQVIDPNNIVINIGEYYTGNPFADYYYSVFNMYYSAPYNIPVTKKQTLDTTIDFKIPSHGFVTGDRVTINNFYNFTPDINGRTYTVTKLDANYIQINIREQYPSATFIKGNWFNQNYVINPDGFIPLPGYVYDGSQPYPHKGPLRAGGTNAQFVPNAFNTNWSSSFISVYDRMLPTSCGGIAGTAGCSPDPYHGVSVNLIAPPAVDFQGLSPDYCNSVPTSTILLDGNQLDGQFSISAGTWLDDGGPSNKTATLDPTDAIITSSVTLDVSYTYTNADNGCTGTITKQVTINPLPVVDAGANVTICEGTSVQIGGPATATGNAPFAFSWSNGASLNDAQLPNPTASPANTTNYIVTVTDKNGCINDNSLSPLTVTVNKPVIVNIPGPATLSVCGDGSSLLDINGTVTVNGVNSPGSWSITNGATGDFYDFGAAVIPSGPFTVDVVDKFLPTIAGGGTVQLTLTGDDPDGTGPTGPCLAESKVLTVNVDKRAMVDPGTYTNVCAGDVIQLNGSFSGSTQSIQWTRVSGVGVPGYFDNVPANTASSFPVTQYTPNPSETNGTITFKLKSTAPGGGNTCPSEEATVGIPINPKPIVVADLPGDNTSVCEALTGSTLFSLTNLSSSVSFGNATWGLTTTGAGTGDFQKSGVTDFAFGFANQFFPSVGDIATGSVSLRLTSDDPDGAGPCVAVYDDVTINISKTARVDAGVDQDICAGTSINLSGSVTGASTTFSWQQISGQGSLTATNTLATTYVPSAIENVTSPSPQVTLRLRADDPDGTGPCSIVTDDVVVTINRKAVVNAGPDFAVCEDQNAVLNGTIPTSTSSASSFTWSGGAGSFSPNTTAGNTRYVFDAAEIGTKVTLTLTSDDPTGPCPAETDDVVVTVNRDPAAPGIQTIPSYCINQPILNLNAVVVPGNSYRWYNNAALVSPVGLNPSFASGVQSNTDKVVDFFVTQTDQITGCEGPATTATIIVNPLPNPDFSADLFCEGDQTQFTDLSTITYTNGRTGTVNSWTWDFRDQSTIGPGSGAIAGTINGTSGTYDKPAHKYPNIGTYDVLLTATSSDGCSNSISATVALGQPVRIGRIPSADFAFQNVCNEDVTQFTYTGTIANQISSFSWDFADPTSPNPTGNTINPTHQYSAVNTYPVALTVTTDLGCINTVTKAVSILPYIKSFTYRESFENTGHGWVTQGFTRDPSASSGPVLNSWNLMAPGGLEINSASDGTKVWITNNPGTGTYSNSERSVLYGPCVDLTQLPRPVIGFDYWNSTHNNDGAYLEYSLNGGQSWLALGSVGSGLEWYNESGLTGLSQINGVGQAISQIGWSGKTNGWQSAKYNLDFLSTETKIRFRFVFGSNGDNPATGTYDGFAMDNFLLDSRDRLVLVENFTNLNGNVTANNDNFRQFKSQTPGEVVKVQYHTNFPTPDDLNKVNPADPSARASFYGVTSSPVGFVNGYTDVSSGASFLGAWSGNRYDLQSLIPADLSIAIANPVADANADVNGKLDFSVTVTANKTAIPADTYTLFIGVIENGVNGQDFVLRKLIPNASGSKLPAIALNGTFTVNESFVVDAAYVKDITKLAFVAFVQADQPDNKGARKVLQAAINSNVPQIALKTGLESNFLEQITVYPNPADEEVTILLPAKATSRVEVQLLDQVGKSVARTSIPKGDREKTLNVRDLPGAIYLIKLEENGRTTYKRAMVIHRN